MGCGPDSDACRIQRSYSAFSGREMAGWIEASKREDRAPHKYALEDFGLVRSDVEQRFAAYRAAFLEGN